MSSPPDVPAADERRAPRAGNRLKRRLIDLITLLHRWAESGWANTASATWGFLQSAIVPGPSEGLLIPLGVADPARALRLAWWTFVGAVLGHTLAYWIGATAFDTLARPMLAMIGESPQYLDHLRARFTRDGWIVIVLGSLPVIGSAKVMSFAAGAFRVPFPEFLLVIAAIRGIRCLVVGVLLRFAGTGLVHWIERKIGRPLWRHPAGGV